VAGSMYAKLEGSNWVWSLLLSYFLFLGPFFLVSASFLSTIQPTALPSRVSALLSLTCEELRF
jgi:hypothetical protein